MSRLFRDQSLRGSRRFQYMAETITTITTTTPIHPIEDLPSPYDDLGLNFTDSELQQTAYEILVAACRGSGKSLTYISKTEQGIGVVPAPSLNRSLTSSTASRVKKALGLKSPVKKRDGDSVNQGRGKKPVTAGDVIRVQMRVSEQTDSRIRRALLRISSGKIGRSAESMVLPLELLNQFKVLDFSNQQEYKAWQMKNWKILEAGLLLHPHLPLDKTDTAPQRFRQIMQGALEKPMETAKSIESMQALRSIVMSLACRSFDGSNSGICHWADGFPLNLRLYEMLLEVCFDVNEETSIIEEVDEVLELVKKTWVILGVNQILHNLCFLWVIFRRYVATSQVENDLLFAANNLLVEIEKDAKAAKDPVYSKILSSALKSMLDWAEKRLLTYHATFHSGSIDTMQRVVSLAVAAANILEEDISNEYHKTMKEVDVAHDRVDTYIRSSMRSAFAKEMEKVDSSKNLSIKHQNFLPILAQNLSKLAFNEKATYSPMLKRWHTLAAGAAVVTLHSCYGKELKLFVSDISELSPDAIQVLRAADKLEKDLVQIAVEDSVDSEDGGKSIIREMPPYEAEAVIANLVKSWIKIRLDRLKEWVDRNIQQEVWNPRANKEHFAPSAVEVLRIVDETLEAFFLLPIPNHAALLPEMITGLDKCLQHYTLKAKSGCGAQSTFVPMMPALTRCKVGSKFHSVFRKKDKSHNAKRRKSHVVNMNGDNPFGMSQLCVRINTLQHIRTELDVLENRTITHLKNSESSRDDISYRSLKKFELSATSCSEGIQQLCEATAYSIVFHDLSHVLWDGLYVGEISSSRIEPFLEELEHYLEIISSTVHDRVRTRVITEVMKASFHGFLLVLLAGGPSRAFTQKDSEIIEEDFKFLVDLFWSNGDGLPSDLINKSSTTIKGVLPLFHTDTESLVDQFKRVTLECYGSCAKSRLPLPPTSGQWNPVEPNTLLRILCYRNDEIATKFLKKTYNMPKKL